MTELLAVTTRNDWRKWLSKNHRKKEEIWLTYYKKDSVNSTITIDDAVEEAICYGWIDSRIKSIDKTKSAIRFTPRRKNGNWSKYNIARALKLLSEGKMTKSGIEVLPSSVLETWKKRRIPSKVDPRRGTISYK